MVWLLQVASGTLVMIVHAGCRPDLDCMPSLKQEILAVLDSLTTTNSKCASEGAVREEQELVLSARASVPPPLLSMVPSASTTLLIQSTTVQELSNGRTQ